jgi:hypothetical protein
MDQHAFAYSDFASQLVQAQIQCSRSDERTQTREGDSFMVQLNVTIRTKLSHEPYGTLIACTKRYITKENSMNPRIRLSLLILGLLIWIVGSIYYAYRGSQVLETTKAHYWINFFISPLVSALLVVVILKSLRIAPSEWASAGLLLAIPGMIGEAIVLSHLSNFMPRIQEASGGRYGAFLFATYAVVLGIAEIVTLNAVP